MNAAENTKETRPALNAAAAPKGRKAKTAVKPAAPIYHTVTEIEPFAAVEPAPAKAPKAKRATKAELDHLFGKDDARKEAVAAIKTARKAKNMGALTTAEAADVKLAAELTAIAADLEATDAAAGDEAFEAVDHLFAEIRRAAEAAEIAETQAMIDAAPVTPEEMTPAPISAEAFKAMLGAEDAQDAAPIQNPLALAAAIRDQIWPTEEAARADLAQYTKEQDAREAARGSYFSDPAENCAQQDEDDADQQQPAAAPQLHTVNTRAPSDMLSKLLALSAASRPEAPAKKARAAAPKAPKTAAAPGAPRTVTGDKSARTVKRDLPPENTKGRLVFDMLRRPEGYTSKELGELTLNGVKISAHPTGYAEAFARTYGFEAIITKADGVTRCWLKDLPAAVPAEEAPKAE